MCVPRTYGVHEPMTSGADHEGHVASPLEGRAPKENSFAPAIRRVLSLSVVWFALIGCQKTRVPPAAATGTSVSQKDEFPSVVPTQESWIAQCQKVFTASEFLKNDQVPRWMHGGSYSSSESTWEYVAKDGESSITFRLDSQGTNDPSGWHWTEQQNDGRRVHRKERLRLRAEVELVHTTPIQKRCRPFGTRQTGVWHWLGHPSQT